MKPSLIYCKQFEAFRGIVPKEEIKAPDVEKPPPKRRGRKPGSKKEPEEIQRFRIENKEIVIDFS